MFVTKKKYEELYTSWKNVMWELQVVTDALATSDEYIEELEKKLTAKKKVAKKATKKVSKK